MFLNTLYTILDRSDNAGELHVTIRINPGHPLYEGHFPGHPVTPGVVQMEIVRELLELATGKKLRLEQLRQSKFLAVNNPQEHPEMHIRIKTAPHNALEIQAEARMEETVSFRMTACYCEIAD